MRVLSRIDHLVLLAAALTLLPLGLFTGYLSWRAFREGVLYRSAPEMHSVQSSEAAPPESVLQRVNGRFYEVIGPVSGPLLNPPEYPEVKDALWYRVAIERRVSLETSWVRDNSGTLVSERLHHITVGNLPVDVGPMARIAVPVAEAFREVNDNLRYAIESKPVPKGGVHVFGLYQNGILTEGVLDRLLILSADHFEETLAKLERKGRVKGTFLAGISSIFLGLAFVVGRSAVLKGRPLLESAP